jgi:uncharacterized glyoxalase superfamily protein PhnB
MVTTTKGNIIPALRYRDAPAAIDFLCKAFGFERHAVYQSSDTQVDHAQLVLGNGMVMLGSASNEGEYAKWVSPLKTPDDAGTQGVYIVIDDCDAHHARAKAAGARILRPPTDEDYGGRGYTCRDLEGNVWSFGTYDPWATSS